MYSLFFGLTGFIFFGLTGFIFFGLASPESGLKENHLKKINLIMRLASLAMYLNLYIMTG
jgi:hypothetical protein